MIYGIYRDYQQSRTYAFRGNNLKEEAPQSIFASSQTNKLYQRVKKKQIDQPRRQKLQKNRNILYQRFSLVYHCLDASFLRICAPTDGKIVEINGLSPGT